MELTDKERGTAEAFGDALGQMQIKYDELLKKYEELEFDRNEYKDLWNDATKELSELKKHVSWIKNQL